ncbi:D-sedoheptulose 7-phosphate isomerase [Campylobacter jejuni]|uniref:Phosphoheptose isomerase 2 n=4 Tax=Campylobacter jejuni TaxID=197 RepID=GMHA2_CAMJE|nr:MULTISPECIES: D-sedoheptulose 7-phosphate isomerase [Campylobacter]YP_002344807.1 phosphoheptose isomerase [Campylobacter jejuni subsp. jejuni NCTC 11168 = ATCC 700819]Q9PMN3.1 RecName: Full=Phosphoheptose isomerase 2; AltName: Full=Sedoheptulose 7-phosphate isomerase 2 [Campylobacter jejuni subsp. jejuni NCTC 11168 = ATCC 700819]APA81707.1 Phosphoheptose isomerase 2 [Campylobacter jejuni subsp. jejuni D42a]EAI3656827.1 SIS domain-containing protein [Campylobacter fetus]EBD1656227.1 D-sedoh
MENLNSYIKGHFADSILVKEQILKDENLITLIKNASLEVIKAYKNGNKTLLAGNGGSAADAQHIAGEFVSRFYFDRPGIASIALTTDTSILTAIGNDYGYENLFARQVQAQGVKGDVFIGISTSGNSKNILKALEFCKQKEIISIGLSGASGGAMNELCDYCIKVPSTCTPRIQEAHILIGHIICAIVEEELFGKGFSCKQ